MKKRNRLLIIEPYYGGSHRAFLHGLLESVSCDYKLLTLPARKWKMRMQLSAPWFTDRVREAAPADRWYDTVLCSTFVDVAVLRAMLQQLDGWNQDTRFCTYFHENQFVYPGQVADKTIQQFTAINFTTAIVSDGVAFNSAYNMKSFLGHSGSYVKKAADMCIRDCHTDVAAKSVVLHPGMDYRHIDEADEVARESVPVIVWNHRWEHDKNPEEFFRVLRSLKEKGTSFKLILLGQSFKNQPECFLLAKEYFADHLIHSGYAESRRDYAMLLRHADIVVSTAVHEFFGISVLEAVRAGCIPLLPKRLSYPELFPEKYLYDEGGLEIKLEEYILSNRRLLHDESRELTEKHCWNAVAESYMNWLFG